MAKWIVLPLTLAILGLATLAGYQWAKASVAQDIYRDRLSHLQQDYQQLATQYNQAVTPRPVTELLVEEGIVCLAVRKGDGQVVRIPTTFNVRLNRVYVDYLLVDQRLMIFRAFEFNTVNAVPPDKVVTIDPALLDLEGDLERVPFGKSLSCRNLPDGRYLISVTGDGSLGLKPVSADEPIQLTTHPPIKEFAPVDEQAHDEVESITFGDVWRSLTQ